MPVSLLSQCFTEIKKWMSENFLCLNSDKIEVMLIGSPHQLRKESITLSVDGSALQFQTKLKNLGVIFDANLTIMFVTQSKHHFFISETLPNYIPC